MNSIFKEKNLASLSEMEVESLLNLACCINHLDNAPLPDIIHEKCSFDIIRKNKMGWGVILPWGKTSSGKITCDMLTEIFQLMKKSNQLFLTSIGLMHVNRACLKISRIYLGELYVSEHFYFLLAFEEDKIVRINYIYSGEYFEYDWRFDDYFLTSAFLNEDNSPMDILGKKTVAEIIRENKPGGFQLIYCDKSLIHRKILVAYFRNRAK